jgi:hypothetical protein
MSGSHKKVLCKRGHVLNAAGRGKDGGCLLCTRLRANAHAKAHPEKANIRNRRYKANHPEKTIDDRRKWQYNITPDQYKQMLEEQQNRCKVCTVELSCAQRLTMPCIDHDHRCCPAKKSCGKCVRGIICYGCNVVLGFSKDNIVILENAIQYLKETTQKCQNESNTASELKELQIPTDLERQSMNMSLYSAMAATA